MCKIRQRGKKLYIFGAGDFGREIVWAVERMNYHNTYGTAWEICGFLDSNLTLSGKSVDRYPVIGGEDYLTSLQEESWIVCSIGSAKTRKRIIEKICNLGNQNLHFATIIDPEVSIGDDAEIGEGCVLCAGAVLTVGCKIGPHCHINLNSTIGHDVRMDGFDTVYPGANLSGHVTVGECTEIGTGTQIIQGKHICGHVILGAGTVVIRDIETPGTYVGVPAHPAHAE